MSKNSIKNGKKGGRPKTNKYISSISIPEINTVILSEHQYETLLERYGTILLMSALKILDDWLNTSYIGNKYRGKNNYALFRSDGWLINEAKLNSIQQT